MTFEYHRIGDYLKLEKGMSYGSKNLVDQSDTGLLTIAAFRVGGGFKAGSEKPFDGAISPNMLLSHGDVLVAMTEQDYGLLASPLRVDMNSTSFSSLTFSLDVARLKKLKEGLEPEFVHEVLRIPAFRRRAAYGDTGSTVQRLPYDALGEFEVPVPPIGVQKSISGIAQRIDSLIRDLGKEGELLESIAQTLFRSWFVDFDTVRAKMRGEKPVGMDDATAALFPDSMEESELGDIPAGWNVGLLGDFCKLVMGQSPPGSAYNEEGIGLPFFQGRADFGERFPRRRVYSTEGKRKALAGEILVTVRAPVGDINQALEESVIGRGVAAVKHLSGSEPYSFSLLKSLRDNLEYYNGEGTVFGAINKADFSSIKLIEAPGNVIAAFDEACSPINRQIRVLHDQTKSLVSVRDSLLPRLISGELQVPEDLVA